MNGWLEDFRNPEAKYRPHLFWSWNGDLQKNELLRQLRDLSQTGHGGFFMHARDGLTTPYMGEEWFSLISAVSSEAARLGLEPWCYDERGWPSGSCDGAVPAKSPQNRVRWLRLLDCDGTTEGEVIRYYAVRADGTYRNLPYNADGMPQSGLSDGERIMYASQFTDDNYTDILNPDAVSDFIESTHKRYYNTVGCAACGFFTDEPQYALCRTPWSPVFEREFMHEYGYSITDHLPELFLGRDGHEAVRFDFWRLVSRLYTESFAGQIYRWCNSHSYRLTGHSMMEDNLLCQIHCSAGAMPMYEYMHIPGVDWLGRFPPTTDDGTPIPTTPLQVGSAASQLGRRQVITESFAMAGHDVSFAEMRYLAEWQMLYGVNLLCQHLFPYTIRGERKNDFPPAVSYHAPWWSEYRAFNDTVSRLGKIMSCGEDDPGVLLIHPMHSVWLKYTNDDMNAETALDRSFAETEILLDSAHIPFHLGDETLIARHGSVTGNRLVIGRRSYRTVFLPTVFGLDRTTFELLRRFTDGGGRLAVLGDKPEFINGRRAQEELASLLVHAVHITPDRDSVFRFVSDIFEDTVRISGAKCDEKAIRHCRRVFPDDGVTAYLFLNTDREHSHRVDITLPSSRAAELCCDSMELYSVDRDAEDGRINVSLDFAPMESRLLLIGDGVPHGKPAAPTASEIIDLRRDIKSWHISPDSDPNCMLLDYCCIENGRQSQPMHVWSAAHEWHGEDIRFTFTVGDGISRHTLSDMRLVSEFSNDASISVNGHRVSALPGEWWLDHSFSVYEIGTFVRCGENEITVTCTQDNGIGYMYLTGNFGVFADSVTSDGCDTQTSCGKFRIGERPTELISGNIVAEGHPFFCGRLVLECEVDVKDPSVPYRAVLGKPNAAFAKLSVNRSSPQLLAWGKFDCDITGHLAAERNLFRLELTVGLGNLLGPHHVYGAARHATAPEDFIPASPSKWHDSYSFAPAGIGRNTETSQ